MVISIWLYELFLRQYLVGEPSLRTENSLSNTQSFIIVPLLSLWSEPHIGCLAFTSPSTKMGVGKLLITSKVSDVISAKLLK